MYEDQNVGANPLGIQETVGPEQDNPANDFLYGKTAQQIIERVGFKQKTYELLSEDGYITELIHLINPLAQRAHLKQPPVLLMHGALVDCVAYMWASTISHHPEKYPRLGDEDGPITSSNRSLAFYLANNGYDVWLANWRGSNPQNSRHTRYKPRHLDDLSPTLQGEARHNRLRETMAYYDFSQDDLLQYEVPLQLETVLDVTQSEQVSVVAWSISTQLMFKLLVSNEELASKVHSYVALTPLLNANGLDLSAQSRDMFYLHMPLPLGHLYVNQLILSRWNREFMVSLRQNSMLSFLKMYTSIIQSVTIWELPVIDHACRSTSFKVIKQYFQQKYQGQLQMYDYGPWGNMQAYNGSAQATRYDLAQFRVKHWMMISARKDQLGTPDSVREYAKRIPVAPRRVITVPHYDHFDVVSGHLNDIYVNKPILDFLDQTSTSSSSVSLD